MSSSTEPGSLTQDQEGVIYRAATEGVPVAAIGRMLKLPFETISDALKMALAGGMIVRVPRADWPGREPWDERQPQLPKLKDDPLEVEFACRQHFKLTSLEAGFMVSLLSRTCSDKEKLHGIVEEKRQMRATRPDRTDSTDPKMVDVIICKLRQKLAGKGFDGAIQTLWGRGYFIEPKTKTAMYKIIGLEPDHARDAADGRGSPAGSSE